MEGVIPVLRALRGLEVDALARLVAAWRVPARAASGLVDVAEWLVEPAHAREALERLGWRELHRLARGEPSALARARDLALAADDDGAGGPPELFPGVAAALAELLRDTTVLAPSASANDETGADVDAERDARGAARTHAVAALVADVVADLDATPRAGRDGRGGARLAGVEVRRIASDLDLDAPLVESVAEWMHRAGFVGPSDDTWSPTALGREAAGDDRAARWRALADAWLATLSVSDREAVLGRREATPPTRGLDAVAAAEALGLRVEGALTTAGRLALGDELEAAALAVASRLPAEVEGVYVQPDLSVIAPGPLAPNAEVRLRALADLERRGTASTYRLSPASIGRALASGRTADEIAAALRELSLVPLPQPVTYLIAATSERHGLVRVRPVPGGTLVHSADAAALDHLEVDQALAALRLRRRPDGALETRLAPAHVASALAEARHPVMAEDEAGRATGPRPPRTAAPPGAEPPAAALRFAAALQDDAARHADADEASAWRRQLLDRARRAKTPVRLRVRIDGTEPIEVRVVPVSRSARWLRVVDAEAEVERTFPLSAVELLAD